MTREAILDEEQVAISISPTFFMNNLLLQLFSALKVKVSTLVKLVKKLFAKCW
jgi:hypothetical protein